MRRVLPALLLLAATAVAAKPSPSGEYAWSWPLAADSSAGAIRVVLQPDVYAHIADPGLRDLAVFNAAGAEVPFGPIPATQSLTAMQPPSRDLPWFALPSMAPGTHGSDVVHLTLQRGPDGTLSRLDLDMPATAPRGDALARDFVLDLGAEDARAGVDGLVLEWQPLSDGISARFRVSASDDLVAWQTVLEQAGIADLRQGEFVLVRKRIELPGAPARYLLLERLDDGASLVATRFTATSAPQYTPNAPPRAWTDAQSRPSSIAGEYVFESPGPLPIERIEVTLASESSVANVRVASRPSADAPWRERRAFTAFRFGGAQALRNEDQSVDVTRDRWWRIVAESPLDAPPTLRLAYRPEEFALLPRGAAPFTLFAGSAQARRSDFPLAVLLAEVRSRLGTGWRPADATIGQRQRSAGESALAIPPAPVDTQRWLLWAILVGGALLVLVLVLRLMGGDKEEPGS